MSSNLKPSPQRGNSFVAKNKDGAPCRGRGPYVAYLWHAKDVNYWGYKAFAPWSSLSASMVGQCVWLPAG